MVSFNRKTGIMWLDLINLVPLLGILQTDQGKYIGGNSSLMLPVSQTEHNFLSVLHYIGN